MEEVAVYAVLISTVQNNTQEPTGLWGNGSYLKSICSTTGVQPRVKCMYIFSEFLILCGLITCTFELDFHLINMIHKVLINKLLLSIIVVEVVVKRIVCTLFHSYMRQSRELEFQEIKTLLSMPDTRMSHVPDRNVFPSYQSHVIHINASCHQYRLCMSNS